jgi:hypothetical protein
MGLNAKHGGTIAGTRRNANRKVNSTARMSVRRKGTDQERGNGKVHTSLGSML